MNSFERFASGSVIYSAPGLTACSVAVARAAYEGARQHLRRLGSEPPYAVYDPCVGGGYLLTVVGLTFGEELRLLYGADSDQRACEIATKNLALCTKDGMERRREELAARVSEFGKESHRIAERHAQDFLSEFAARAKFPTVRVFHGDALAREGIVFVEKIDMVLVDVPYGEKSQWNDAHHEASLDRLVTALRTKLAAPSVVTIISRKDESYAGVDLVRLSKRSIGNRLITFFRGG